MTVSTQQLLDVLRDARDQGLWQEQAAIVDELALDAAKPTRTYWLRAGRNSARRGPHDWLASVEESRIELKRKRSAGVIYAKAIESLVHAYQYEDLKPPAVFRFSKAYGMTAEQLRSKEPPREYLDLGLSRFRR